MVRGTIFSIYALILVGTINAREAHDPSWCGNKHKNLVILQDVLKNDPLAEVPPFLGIETGRVEQFLRQHDPEIFTLYKDATERLNASRSLLRKPVMALRKLINPGYYKNNSLEDVLKSIQGAVVDTFKNNFPFTAEEKAFFQKVAQEKKFLMVRSTGVEDNPNVANAGGNVSVAYVKPALPDIESAMAEVIASYFSMQSLKNRIAGGEILSYKEHTLPVLIQVLVGEPVGGAPQAADIPVSGVAYTTNSYLSSPSFPVTEIDATYGHGEGVVANKVMADRYFIIPKANNLNDITIFPMLYAKNERLVPSLPDNTLRAVKNSRLLAHSSCLAPQRIKELYTVLKKIEKSYGKPMDVEFIVTGAKIYIVQARPAMSSQKEPSYCNYDAIKPTDITPPIHSTMIVPGNGTLQIITNPDDVIIAKTLDEADQRPNSFSAKLVVVETWGSSLSHPAVNFMSHGVPCMYVPDITQISKNMNTVSHVTPLIADTQRGIIFFWKSRDISPDTFIIRGWFEHPIERSLSFFISNAAVVQARQQVLPKDPVLMNGAASLKISTDKQAQKNILTSIDERVKKIFALTERRIKATPYALNAQEAHAFDVFKKTYNEFIIEFLQAIPTLDHFGFLFYHKMLEAFLYQVAGQQQLLAGYTYSYFLNDLFVKQPLRKILQTGTLSFTDELDYGRLCPTQELSTQWTTFMTLLEALYAQGSGEAANSIKVAMEYLKEINTMGNLPLWFATTFYQFTREHTLTQANVKNFIEALAHDYQNHTPFITMLTTLDNDINAFLSSAAKYNTISAAQQHWQEITDKLITPMTSASFIESFNNASFILKMIACDAMNKTIHILDSAIKETKSNNALTFPERVTLFKQMLGDFKLVFKTWVEKIMPENALRYHPSYPLYHYLNHLEYYYNSISSLQETPSLFQRSTNFAVNAAVLGSGTAFDRHNPTTLEDAFMLIHQNSLAAVSGIIKSLFNKPLDDMIYLPPLLQKSISYLETNKSIAISRIGVSYTEQEIKISYNIPLRNHSATAQLIYNTSTHETSLAVQFLGEARSRWEVIAVFSKLSPALSGLHLTENVHFDQQAGLVSWAWKIDKDDDLRIIVQYLAIMGNSLSYSDPLTLAHLFQVFRAGGRPTAESIKPILENATKQWGTSSTIRNLLQQLPWNGSI